MVELRAIDDVDTQKKWIKKNILDAFSNKVYQGKKTILEISNPQIQDKDYSLAEQKDAILHNRNLSEIIKADVKLVDKETNQVLEERKNFHIASMPYHTGRNTIVTNGVSMSVPSNQLRLRPGAYTRKKNNGEIETHFNLQSGTGSGFRISQDPDKGIFKLSLNTVNAPLYPFLKAFNISDDKLKEVWGENIYNINKNADTNITKFYDKLIMFPDAKATDEQKVSAIVDVFKKSKMDKDVNKYTLKAPYENVDGETLLQSTKRILGVSRGLEEEDDRDSMLYKKVYSAEDFYKEKITKDAGNLGKSLMRRLDRNRDLKSFAPGYFTKQLWGTIKSDPSVSPTGTLSQPLEEINPIDIYDQQHKITLLGEGGIGNIREVTMDARNVHPSEFGFTDNVRTPESFNVGIDKRLAYGTKKGNDNQLYHEFVNVKTGKKEWLNPLDMVDKVVAFPDEWNSKKDSLDVMKNGKIMNVPRKEVTHYLATAFEQFSTYDNLLPMAGAIQGNRMILGGKAMAMAVPLKNGEAPLVQVLNTTKQPDAFAIEDGKPENSWEKGVADIVVNKLAKDSGIIVKMNKDNIFIKTKDGKTIRHGLYNDFPLNLKTYLTHKPLVKVGDTVKKGDILAHSNYSDPNGTLALGTNLRTMYAPFQGWNFEDGIVLSETGAKKLTSEHMYTNEYSIDDPEGQIVNRDKYKTMFPSLYPGELYKKYDENGVIKPGSVVKYGDPLILAMEKRPPSARDIQLGNLHKSLRNSFRDASVVWHHTTDGVITDAVRDRKNIKVLVKTEVPAQVGDKITGRYGNKGVVSIIIPDEEMPKIKGTNDTMEAIFTPVGIPSRINPAQIHEEMLSKIAKKIGKVFVPPPFRAENGDIHTNVKKLMNKYDVKDAEDIEYKGQTIPDVINGYNYIWKLSKMSEDTLKKREIGGYDLDQQPIKGKTDQGQALRIGYMELNALLGHGAKDTAREVSAIKGQRNDDYWRRMKLGLPLPQPTTPFVYNKFMTLLKGSGIDPREESSGVRLSPLIDKEILKLSKGSVKNGELIYSKNLNPVQGGLFDPGVTGGVYGNSWSHIKLAEGVPNPVMEDTIKKILRVNEKEFKKLLESGELESKLKTFDTEAALKESYDLSSKKSGAIKDFEFKRIGFLENLKRFNMQPKDLILHNAPVIPPIMRPISVVGTKETIQSGNANLLYKDLIVTNKGLEGLKTELPSEALGSSRKILYDSLKAVVGLGDPINVQNKNRGVTGFIETIVGDQPKTGYFQKKMLSKTQDLVSRGVVSPDPTLSLDEIRIPEETAWHDYKPFVLRRMIQSGESAISAELEYEKRSAKAAKFLELEMKDRPILMNRNPSLTKFNVQAFIPKLNKNGFTIQVPPAIVTGFNMDFDGDNANLFIPASPEAVKEAKEKLLPSKNLFYLKDRQVHQLPSQGTILGLYNLSAPGEGKVKKTYNSMDDLKQDYMSGRIKANDMIELKKG